MQDSIFFAAAVDLDGEGRESGQEWAGDGKCCAKLIRIFWNVGAVEEIIEVCGEVCMRCMYLSKERKTPRMKKCETSLRGLNTVDRNLDPPLLLYCMVHSMTRYRELNTLIYLCCSLPPINDCPLSFTFRLHDHSRPVTRLLQRQTASP